MEPGAAPDRPRPGVALALVSALAIVAQACSFLPNSTQPSASSGASDGAPSVPVFVLPSERSSPSSAATPGPSAPPSRSLAASGSIVVVTADGSLSLVDTKGRSTVLATAGGAMFGFPAWSPDGSRIAAIRFGLSDTAILVFDGARAATGQPVEPVTIFRSTTIGPFYLSWTPDGRDVAFLADEPSGLSLRIAPADGSAPLDGSGARSRIRSGNPFYFDWIRPDRLLAHVGTGSGAFLGEIGLDGASTSPAIASPGDFRAAVVNSDRSSIGFVRSGVGGRSESVVVAGDGSGEHTMPVFGTAAVSFDPSGNTVASIGPIEPGQTQLAIPVGPLRLIDAPSGAIRTLVDGKVVSFWWSPDGRTIAALRVQPVVSSNASAPPTAPAYPISSPTAPPNEVRLLFVDVATASIRSQAVVDPGQLFIDQLLTYFDQYALSHRLWAPDSSSFLLPVHRPDGTTSVAVMFPDGAPSFAIDGLIGFWSP